MDKPLQVVSRWDSAADNLYGSHWFGATFVSLIDPKNAKLINTIPIRSRDELPGGDGNFAIPYFTYDGAYHVPYPDRDRRGKPVLLRLRDLTGEGVAGQFVLFEHIASGVAAGTVIGYSSKSDAVVQYEIEKQQNRFSSVRSAWAVNVFESSPSSAGYWKFTWEAGHGDWEWIDEEVRFDAGRQLFVEKVFTRPYQASPKFIVR